MEISRRYFLKGTFAAAGGLTALQTAETAAFSAQAGTLPQRVLGRTKQRVSLIAFGTAPLGSDNTTPDEAERALHFALDQGINYLDTAPVYGDPKSKYGNAEAKLKGVLKTRRRGVFLVTKVNPKRPDKDGVQRQLEESMKRMGVDSVDAVHIHNLGDWDMATVFGSNGALAGLQEARKKGLLRYIGTSGHNRPGRFVTAIETGEIDLVMNPLNFADRANYDFEGLIPPAARKFNTAFVAMKVLGGAVEWKYDGKADAALGAHYEGAIRYTLGIAGLGAAVIGFKNEEEVRRAIAIARQFKALTSEERDTLLKAGKELAARRGLYYGPATG